MNQPAYVHRFGRVARALHILTLHPDGLPISQLADQLGVDEKSVREEILAYYRADLDPSAHAGLLRDVRIEFLAPGSPGDDPGDTTDDTDDVDPGEAEIVRVSSHRPAEEIGVA